MTARRGGAPPKRRGPSPMRQPFIPLFQDILTSSLWALDQSTPGCLRVWITLLAMTDAKGYVGASLPGLALHACLPLDVVARCIEVFESPDPYSRTQDHDGRRIEKVERGWRLLTYEQHVERARAESRKVSKRKWARDNYDSRPANDVLPTDESAPPVSNSGQNASNLDPSRSRSRSISSEGDDPPLPPRGFDATNAVDAPVLPTVLRTVPEDWQPSEELIAYACAEGLPLAAFMRRLAEWRSGPIGGQRGVLPHKLESLVRGYIPKWRTWEETDRAKAQRDAQAPRGGPGGGRYVSTPQLEANERHRAFAAQHGIDIDAELRRLNEGRIVESLGLTGARENLERCLSRLAREKQQKGASF